MTLVDLGVPRYGSIWHDKGDARLTYHNQTNKASETSSILWKAHQHMEEGLALSVCLNTISL
jgi:hypothetical protein